MNTQGIYATLAAAGLGLASAAAAAAAAKPVPTPEPEAPALLTRVLDVVLLRGTAITLFIMVGYAMWISLKVRAIGPRNAFAGVSLLRTLLGAFGGGLCVPLCLGTRPGPIGNDFVVTAAVIAWFIVHRSPGDIGFKLFGPGGPLRLLSAVCFETFRANFVITCTNAAFDIVKPSLFHIPLWGPLLIGAMAGSFGNFLPFDKGLAPIEGGFSWPMISAFTLAAANSLLMHEPTYGPKIWAVAAPGVERSVEAMRIGAVCVFVTVTLLQETVMGVTWHPLKPLTAALDVLVPAVIDETAKSPITPNSKKNK